MSTRSSIFYGEQDGKTVHIYWELAEREVARGAAPVCISVDGGDVNHEEVIRLPKELAAVLLKVLEPNHGWQLL